MTLKIFGCWLVVIASYFSGSHSVNFMKNQQIVVTTTHLPPLMVIRQDSDGVTHYSGALFEHLQWLSQRLQFKYILQREPANMIGMEVNGSWNGLIGQLIRQEIDLGLFPLTVNHQRQKVLSFTGLFAGGTNVLLTQYPTEQISAGAVLEPFSNSVWVGWLVSLAIVTAVSVAFFRCRTKKRERNAPKTAGQMFFYIFGTFTAQGGYYKTNHRFLDIIAVCWCLAAFVFVNVYNTMLTSTLATYFKYPEINSLQQLADSSTYNVVVIKGSTASYDIQTATSGPYKIIKNKLLKCPQCATPFVEEVGRKVLQGNFIGFQASSTSLGLIKNTWKASKGRCLLTLAFEQQAWMYSYLGAPKTSRYIEEINRESLWAHAHGLPLKWGSFGSKDIPCLLKYNRKGYQVQTFNRPLKLQQLSLAFAVLLAGYGIGLCSLMEERRRRPGI